MIICHIIVGLNVGGAEMMLKRLIDSLYMGSLVKRQVVISLTDIGKVGQLLQASGIEVYELNIGSMKSIFPSVWKLYRIIRSIKPDIVQTWMYHADLFGGIVAKLAGCKHIIWGIRNTDISLGAKKMTVKLRWICAKFSGFIPNVIICVAEKARKEHIKLGYAAEKIVVIPNGYDFSTLQADHADVELFRVANGLRADNTVIGFVARFNRGKDPLTFVRSAALIANLVPHARFLMVGRNCDYQNKELTSWIESTGHLDRFILLGERKDVPVCLKSMDVFCLSSLTEGFPNALAEAMAMRKLCVTTDVGDSASLIQDCGIVVPQQNPQALADGVMSLLALSSNDRIELESRAHERVVTEFSISKITTCFESIYSQLFGSKFGSASN